MELFIRTVIAKSFHRDGSELLVDEGHWENMPEAARKHYIRLYKRMIKSALEETK